MLVKYIGTKKEKRIKRRTDEKEYIFKRGKAIEVPEEIGEYIFKTAPKIFEKVKNNSEDTNNRNSKAKNKKANSGRNRRNN